MAIEGGLKTIWFKVWNYYIFIPKPLDMKILPKCFLYLRTYFRELSYKCKALKKPIGATLHTELYLRLRATIGGTPEKRVTIKQRTALFCVTIHRVVVISYRRFGTVYRFHSQGSRVQNILEH
jgi:hypothetical protein